MIAAVNLKLVTLVCASFVITKADYWNQRHDFLLFEANKIIGGNLNLSKNEEIVNNLLMKQKYSEYDKGFLDPERFPPAKHFFFAKDEIEESTVFNNFIKKMPKGALLHGHDTALASHEFVFNLTYRDNLYGQINGKKQLSLKFFDKKPQGNDWELLKDMRANATNLTQFNNYLHRQLSLLVDNPTKIYLDINIVWQKFISIFITVTPMLTYRPVFEDYFYQVLKEHYEDNVMYLEMRGTLPPVYELNGTIYNEIQVVGIYKKVLDEFMLDYPDFYGAKFIFAPLRHASPIVFDHYIKVIHELVEKYPDFIAGFDLVGQEDLGMPLMAFVPKLQEISRSGIKLFFHAGETNWYGTSTDLNLVDAILLGTTRIGHGYALMKHPKVLELVKQRGIAIEVSPISNQVLKLVDDLRNHPANMYIANNYPVVICNDDPSFWGVRGLSYDFYEAFMGLTSREADIRILKQLALNSLIYSAMSDIEKTNAIKKWETSWTEFINSFLSKTEEEIDIVLLNNSTADMNQFT